jgi:magnesium-transporting ATPase (P-type)
MHILFGGTKLLQSTGDKSAKIKTPDGGCLAVVLRTGFGTAQGAWLASAATAAAQLLLLNCVVACGTNQLNFLNGIASCTVRLVCIAVLPVPQAA